MSTKRKPSGVKRSWVHHPAGAWVDPDSGKIFNRFGRELGSKRGHAYIRISLPTGLFYAHRLVFEAVNGPIPAGLCINHINGNKHDNHPKNLEVVTPSENMKHAWETGLAVRGEQHPSAKMTEQQVLEIRASKGISDSDWAERLGVSRSAVSMARRGINWRDAGCLRLLRGEGHAAAAQAGGQS